MDPIVLKCIPSLGYPGQLIKIYGKDFPEISLSKVCVDFGNIPAKEIHAIRGNIIVCEVPFDILGPVPVKVSFNARKSYVETKASFWCLNPQNNCDEQKFLIHLKQVVQEQLNSQQNILKTL